MRAVANLLTYKGIARVNLRDFPKLGDRAFEQPQIPVIAW